MGFDISLSGMKNVERLFRRVRQRISDVNELNSRRADAFMRFTRQQAATSALGLFENTETTRKIQRSSHPPLFISGSFARSMQKRRNPDKSYDAGFLKSNMAKPKGRTDWAGWTSRPRLTFTELANIHKTGYRIPTSPDTGKGRRVRAFLSAHGVHLRKSTKVLVVVPRDILGEAVERYRGQRKDLEFVKKHVENAVSRRSG